MLVMVTLFGKHRQCGSTFSHCDAISCRSYRIQ